MDKRDMDFPLSSNCILFLLLGHEEIWNIWLRLDFIPLSYFFSQQQLLSSPRIYSKFWNRPMFLFRLYGVAYTRYANRTYGYFTLFSHGLLNLSFLFSYDPKRKKPSQGHPVGSVTSTTFYLILFRKVALPVLQKRNP